MLIATVIRIERLKYAARMHMLVLLTLDDDLFAVNSDVSGG